MDKPKCEHVIGIYYDYEDTEIVTFSELKTIVECECQFRRKYPQLYSEDDPPWTLSDYCDRRKNTNFTHFNFCPKCGQNIDWKTLKQKVRK